MRDNKTILSNPKIWDYQKLGILNTAKIKLSDSGTCTVIWCDNEDGNEHVSVSPKHKYNIPTWEDMCQLKEVFFDEEEEVYQIHPKHSQYVNLKNNCLHLWKPRNGKTLEDLVKM